MNFISGSEWPRLCAPDHRTPVCKWIAVWTSKGAPKLRISVEFSSHNVHRTLIRAILQLNSICERNPYFQNKCFSWHDSYCRFNVWCTYIHFVLCMNIQYLVWIMLYIVIYRLSRIIFAVCLLSSCKHHFISMVIVFLYYIYVCALSCVLYLQIFSLNCTLFCGMYSLIYFFQFLYSNVNREE